MDLFQHRLDQEKGSEAPLAARMRPVTLHTFVGQEHLVGEGRVLRKAIETGQIPSIILWGPPGSGKTTLASVIANTTDSHFASVSAVSAGVSDLRRIIQEAQERRKLYDRKTILFIDEIHRFSKSQQDAVLPYVEDGTVTLIGATTENPSFEVNAPLLSRARLFTLKPLSEKELRILIMRALRDKLKGLGELNVDVDDDAMLHLVMMADHDARTALSALELAALATHPDAEGRRHITLAIMEDAVQQRALRYDRAGDRHYDFISALHKSMRGSDPDASLYWLARMVESGESPLYIARRLARFASEDIGMADPQALVVAMAAQQAVHFIGMPEGNLALAEAVVYLATAPKSNALYSGYSQAQSEIKQGVNEPVPLHLRNPVTREMRQLGYGKGYRYAHDFPRHFVEQQNLPERLQGRRFYVPSEQGFEKEVASRLDSWRPGRRASPGERSEGMGSTHLEFPSDDIVLEGELHLPPGDGPFTAVAVCHPHSLYGGNMNNGVVTAICGELCRRSVAALRFNLRGVGRSGGSFSGGTGERRDVVAALDLLSGTEKVDASRLGLAGYSFGGGVALPVAINDERVQRLALVSPALSDDGWKQLDRLTRPKLAVVGEADSVIKLERFREIAAASDGPNDYAVVAGADHFWAGLEADLAALVAGFFAPAS